MIVRDLRPWLVRTRLRRFDSSEDIQDDPGTVLDASSEVILPFVEVRRQKLREKIALKQQDRIEQFCGKIELDESYFGGHRKGKRGRGSAGKVAVFGILKRQGKVYTQVIDNTQTSTLMPIIKDKIVPDSIVYTDCYRSYNALDVSEFHHFRINHSNLLLNLKELKN